MNRAVPNDAKQLEVPDNGMAGESGASCRIPVAGY
jgi:hypothetical protein